MTPFVRQTIVELRRAVDTRAPRWAFIATVLGGLGLGLLTPGGVRGSFADFVAGAALGLPLLIGLLAVMVFTADWSTRAALASFLLTPRRERVIAARYVAVLVLAVGSVVALHILGAAAYGMLHPSGIGTVFEWSVHRQFSAVLGTSVGTALTAVAVAGLVLRTAPALVVAVFAPLLLTLGLAAVPGVLDWVSPYGFAGWLAAPVWSWESPGDEAVGLGPASASFAVWTAAPLVLGWFRQMRAEPR